jgi:2-methylcitrate dehydratase PrpD
VDGVTEPGGARRFAEFALALRLDDIPVNVIEAAKLHLLDVLGCGLAAVEFRTADAGRALALADGGTAEASLLCSETRVPAASAAFANGMSCHALDYDDTHAGSVCHVSTVVAPAALAAGEAAGAGGAAVLAALIAGSEIVTRVGMAASGAFHARGFHSTSVCGVFGAAAAAARLRGLGAKQATSALGLAGSMASGLFAYLADGTATKPVHAGLAAQAGIRAAALAALGEAGPPSVFEAEFGLYRAFTDVDPAGLAEQLADLGDRWETLRIAFKAYPACHYIHGSLGSTAALVAENSLEPDDIVDVEVSVPPGPAVSLVLEPAANKIVPRTEYEGKFSLQYSTAAMLVHGEVGVETYGDAALSDRVVLAIARRVRYRVEAFATTAQAFPGGVRIELRDGRILSRQLDYQPGAPENPLSPAEVETKFRANARPALGDDGADELLAAVRSLEEHDDLSAALAPLRAAARLSPVDSR